MLTGDGPLVMEPPERVSVQRGSTPFHPFVIPAFDAAGGGVQDRLEPGAKVGQARGR